MCCDHCQGIRRRFDFDHVPVDKIKYIEDMSDRIDAYIIQILCKVYYKKIMWHIKNFDY